MMDSIRLGKEAGQSRKEELLMAIDRWRPFATSVEQWDPVPFFWSKSLMSSAALLGAPAGPSARSTWNGVAPQRGRPWCTSSGESRLERQYRVGRDTTVSRGSEREGA